MLTAVEKLIGQNFCCIIVQLYEGKKVEVLNLEPVKELFDTEKFRDVAKIVLCKKATFRFTN